VDHTGVRPARAQDADRHREARDAERVVVRAVERVDHPDELAIEPGCVGALLGDDPVPGEARADGLEDRGLGGDVGARDAFAGSLPPGVEGPGPWQRLATREASHLDGKR
jgi:hypothetical protein